MTTEMEMYIRETVAKMDAERKNASCYVCGKKEECMYDGRQRATCSFEVWCDGCVQSYHKKNVNSWKPDDRCNCDECSDAKYYKKVPIPNECELYPYWTFTKIKTK